MEENGQETEYVILYCNQFEEFIISRVIYTSILMRLRLTETVYYFFPFRKIENK